DRFAENLEALVKHLTLYDTRAQIIVAMQYQQWGGDFIHISNGRFAHQDVTGFGVPGITSKMIGHKAPGVRLAEKSRQIINATLRHGGFESMIMADHPRRKISRVRATGDHQSLRIDPWFLRGF